MRGAGLTSNTEKVNFAQSQISFLGHLISSNRVTVEPERIHGIRDFRPPKDAKGIARFVGMVNVYRRFIPETTLNNQRKKGTKFERGGTPKAIYRPA